MVDGQDTSAAEQVYAAVQAVTDPENLVTHAIMIYSYTRVEGGGHGIGFKTTDTPDWMLRGLLAEVDTMITETSIVLQQHAEEEEDNDDAE